MSPLFVMLFMLLHQLFYIRYLILIAILFPLYAAFYIILYLKLKSDNKKIMAIGTIEFTQSGIKKRIGDSLSEFSYKSVKSLELKKHIPAVTITESKSGFFSYLLSITFHDLHIETYVISDLPDGKWHDLSITETIKTLKKITHTEINLK